MFVDYNCSCHAIICLKSITQITDNKDVRREAMQMGESEILDNV